MCGIVGIVAKNSENYKEHLNRMVESLYHRGPDENGSYFFDNCALGHTRLSIIDLNSGQQPMKSSVSDTVIAFNGEIYGYQEIKNRFQDYPFRTKSDTEVILALYDKYGIDMMPHLPGMFSFAIWDEAKHRLFCARDRFGEKPFYYAFGKNGEFIFASEIKAIIASGLVEPAIDKDTLWHYLKYVYIHPHQTVYKNIYILPPAHLLIYENNNLKVEKYWELPQTNEKIDFNEAVEEFERLFERAVQKQLIADVPVGIFLSGGLDSSSIVAAASKHKEKLQTFSFGFPGSKKNELHFARDVANMYNTEHIELTDNRDDLASLLIEMQDIYDEPFADNSNIPTYLISKLAKKHTTVVLAGDGGDELLAGYKHHRKLFDLSENKTSWLSYQMLHLQDKICKKWDSNSQSNLNMQKDAYNFWKKYSNMSDAHNGQMERFSDDEINKMTFNANFDREKHLFKFDSKTIDDALRIDINSYLAGDILVKIDRAAMANSLELRAPFLDIDFASFCVSLPANFKINKHSDKLIMRKCYETEWPETIRNRYKQGFGIPIREWLERPDFIELKSQYLDDKNKKIFDIVDSDNTRIHIEKNNPKTWILLVLSMWLESHSYSLK